MSKGFTIIELVISIFILSVGVVGIFSAFSVVTILTSDSADRLTATYLAQEGMEIVRNIRDTNWLNMDLYNCVPGDTSCGYTWVDGLTPVGNNNYGPNCSSTSSAGGCEADYTTTGFSSNPVLQKTGDYLMINGNGFYNYTLGTNTKFQRKVIIAYATDANSNPINYIIKVTVQVSWNEKATILNSSGASASNCNPTGVSNCIVAEETLYDWYNYVNH